MRFNHVLRTSQRFLVTGVLITAWAVTATSCATTKPRHVWTEQALDAETAQFEGRLAEAEAEYRRLLPDAPDDDRRRWLLYNLGVVSVERGDGEEALQRFETVWAEDVRDLHGANALYETAKLYDGPRGIEVRLDLARRYPEQVSAEFAVQDVVSEFLGADRYEALEQTLETLTKDVRGTGLEDNLWFELARLRSEYLDDPNGSLEAYRELYRRHAGGPLADDALWEMANIYRAHQQWEPALVLLGKLAEEVEASWFIGDYESDWVDDAIFDAGWINLVHRGDYDEAQRWFKRYLKDFPLGLLSDDAAWHLLEITRLQGDEVAYRRELEAFVEEYPESRYVRRARERLGGAT